MPSSAGTVPDTGPPVEADFRTVTMIEDQDRARVAFLLATYDVVGADVGEVTTVNDIGSRLGMTEAEALSTAKWLVDRRLLKWVAFGGIISMTPDGADQAEDRLRRGESTPHSVIVLSVEEQRAVEAFLTDYRRAEEEGVLGLHGDDALEADAEVRTIDAQLHSPCPKRRVIRASLRELHGLLQSAAGSAIWSAVEELLRNVR